MPDNQVPAGWYPDPTGDTSKIRYWNGSAWTDDFMDAEISAGRATVGTAAVSTGAVGQPPSTMGTAPSADIPTTAAQQAYGYQQPTYQGAGVPGVAPGTDRKGFAIAALVLGVIGLFGCIFSWLDVLPTTLAIIFGGLGLKSSGRGMAIAGIILGVVGFILIGIVVLFVFDVIADPTKYGLPANYFDYLLGVFLRLS